MCEYRLDSTLFPEKKWIFLALNQIIDISSCKITDAIADKFQQAPKLSEEHYQSDTSVMKREHAAATPSQLYMGALPPQQQHSRVGITGRSSSGQMAPLRMSTGLPKQGQPGPHDPGFGLHTGGGQVLQRLGSSLLHGGLGTAGQSNIVPQQKRKMERSLSLTYTGGDVSAQAASSWNDGHQGELYNRGRKPCRRHKISRRRPLHGVHKQLGASAGTGALPLANNQSRGTPRGGSPTSHPADRSRFYDSPPCSKVPDLDICRSGNFSKAKAGAVENSSAKFYGAAGIKPEPPGNFWKTNSAGANSAGGGRRAVGNRSARRDAVPQVHGEYLPRAGAMGPPPEGKFRWRTKANSAAGAVKLASAMPQLAPQQSFPGPRTNHSASSGLTKSESPRHSWRQSSVVRIPSRPKDLPSLGSRPASLGSYNSLEGGRPDSLGSYNSLEGMSLADDSTSPVDEQNFFKGMVLEGKSSSTSEDASESSSERNGRIFSFSSVPDAEVPENMDSECANRRVPPPSTLSLRRSSIANLNMGSIPEVGPIVDAAIGRSNLDLLEFLAISNLGDSSSEGTM